MRQRRRASEPPNRKPRFPALIAKVQRLRRRKPAYRIIFDNDAVLEVSEAVRARHAIHAGEVLSADEYARILAEDAEHRAREVALNYLSYRPRSSGEVMRHLQRKGFSHDVGGQVVRQFQALSLINDQDFAKMFVRDRLARRPMGAARLRLELQQRGIVREMADAVVRQYVTGDSESEAAWRLAEQRWRKSRTSRQRGDHERQRQRLVSFLVRRGFPVSVAVKTVTRLTST